jgi:hypothetical protein
MDAAAVPRRLSASRRRVHRGASAPRSFSIGRCPNASIAIADNRARAAAIAGVSAMNRFLPCFVRPLLLGLAVSVALAACGGDDANPNEPGRQVKSRAGEGRKETAGIRNTENIGYAGNAIGAKVDQAIEINESRPADLEKQLDEQTR